MLGKIINKILDNYFAVKVINGTELVLMQYRLDMEWNKEKDGYRLFVKRKEYNDTMWIGLIHFDVRESFNVLLKIDDFLVKTVERIEQYNKR